MTSAVSASRVQDLIKLQCRIFSQLYNPTCIRTGNSVLRARLHGPAMASYYPRRIATIKDVRKMYPGFETYEEDAADREDAIVLAKARGKGAPKKKRTAEESKKFQKRRPNAAPKAAPK